MWTFWHSSSSKFTICHLWNMWLSYLCLAYFCLSYKFIRSHTHTHTGNQFRPKKQSSQRWENPMKIWKYHQNLMKGFNPPFPTHPPWSHHNNRSGEAVLLSLGPGRWGGGNPEEQIKFRQKCFSTEISYTKSAHGPLILCPQRTKTRTFKTSI